MRVAQQDLRVCVAFAHTFVSPVFNMVTELALASLIDRGCRMCGKRLPVHWCSSHEAATNQVNIFETIFRHKEGRTRETRRSHERAVAAQGPSRVLHRHAQ